MHFGTLRPTQFRDSLACMDHIVIMCSDGDKACPSDCMQTRINGVRRKRTIRKMMPPGWFVGP